MTTDTIPDQFDIPEFANDPAMHKFLAAWHGWRGNDLVPNRKTVRLSDISSVMSHAMLLDMVSPTQIMCRFMGSIYMDIYGKDFTGRNYLDITQPQFREARSKRLFCVVDQPCAAVWSTNSDMGGGKTATAVGVSVPIIPATKGAPMQLMQTLVFSVAVPPSEYGKPTRYQHFDFSNRFETIDIGAGCPTVE